MSVTVVITGNPYGRVVEKMEGKWTGGLSNQSRMSEIGWAECTQKLITAESHTLGENAYLFLPIEKNYQLLY